MCQRIRTNLGEKVISKLLKLNSTNNREGETILRSIHDNQVGNRIYSVFQGRLTLLKAPTRSRLILFFAAKHGEALHSQQKQDQELTVAQIMNTLLPNSDLN